jgi:hypothetical protein
VKPQFTQGPLDAVDRWPHRFGMTSDRTAPKAETSRDRQAQIEAEREAKLALALRKNLRRRKAEPKPRAGSQDGDSN